MPRFHFTRDEIGMLKNGLDEVTRAAKKAAKALDSLGLVDMRVAGYETLAEVVSSKTRDALGEGDGCDVDLGTEETQTARLGCTLLLTSYAKLAETEVSLFVDTAATHDRANDVRRVRDKLDGQGIIVEEPKKAGRRRTRTDDDAPSTSPGLSIVRAGMETVEEAEVVEPRAALANPDTPNADGYTDGETRLVTDPPTDGDNRVETDDFVDVVFTIRPGEDDTTEVDTPTTDVSPESLGTLDDADDFEAPLPDETIDALAEQEILKIRSEDEAAPMVIPHVIVRDKSPNDDEAPKGKARRATLEQKVKAHTAASKKAKAPKRASEMATSPMRAKADAPRKITPAPKPAGKGKKAKGVVTVGADGGDF